MAGYSKSELINWLNEGPKTMNWGAILAFNRADTNTVLLQEYIERFSTGSYLPPVQGYVGDSSTVGQYMTGYVMDYPRLSFEIADVEKEIPDARLAMRVIGGTQVTFADIPGGREATRIEVVDPLNGPELTLKVHLVDAPTSVTAGKVVMDLSRSSEFSLSYSDFVHEQQLGGEFFQKLFEGLPDHQRVMVISELAADPDAPFRATGLKIRTQAAPGAKMRSADNYGDGAVLLFVGLNNEPNGGNPDDSFKYLIPNDSGKNYGVTLLLGNKAALQHIANSLERAHTFATSYWHVAEQSTGFWGVRPGNLTDSSPYNLTIEDGYHSLRFFSPFDWQVMESGKYMNIVVKEGRVHALFERADPDQGGNIRVSSSESSVGMDFGVDCTVDISKGYQLNVASQIIEPTGDYVWHGLHYTTHLGAESTVELNRMYYSKWSAFAESFYRDFAFEHAPDLLVNFPPFDTFALRTLLFKNNNAVVLDDMAITGDIAIFGRIGPALTKFTLEPLQPLIGAGETLQFTTRPAGISGLSWKVENILGGSGDPGTISSGGLYTAPASISGAFTRVKVTASGGGNSSSALVSVVVNDITVGPLIQTCDGGHTRTLSAGTKGSGALSWSLKTPANGGTLAPDGNGKQVYTAPSGIPDKSWILEEIVVKNQLTNKTKSAWVMVVLAKMTLSVMPDTSAPLPAGQTKLKVRSGATDVPDEALTWETLAGSGSVTNGVYTQPATLVDRFVLVMATYEPLPGMKFEGYALLPLPMFDYPQNVVRGLSFMAV